MTRFLPLLILIADIYAIWQVVQSRESNQTKALWIIGIVLLPVIGLIAWLVVGPSPAEKWMIRSHRRQISNNSAPGAAQHTRPAHPPHRHQCIWTGLVPAGPRSR